MEHPTTAGTDISRHSELLAMQSRQLRIQQDQLNQKDKQLRQLADQVIQKDEKIDE